MRLGHIGEMPHPVSLSISLIPDVQNYTLSYELQIDNKAAYISGFESSVTQLNGQEATVKCELLTNPRPSPYKSRKFAICLPPGSSVVKITFFARHVRGTLSHAKHLARTRDCQTCYLLSHLCSVQLCDGSHTQDCCVQVYFTPNMGEHRIDTCADGCTGLELV
jgi:hypothetical protein